uniref:Putative DNA ligase domain protein n=1 Tax=viral metagenome TaxID=1070528 RepID=A0A6M3M2R4_9ZZZZ
MNLLSKQHAQEVLAKPGILKKDPDPVIIDDHRWIHMWANAIRDNKDVFLTKDQMRTLHDLYVTEFMRRGLNHQSPLKFGAFELIDARLAEVLAARESFLVDPAFINYVGSSVSDKVNPRDLDVLFRTEKREEYGSAYFESLPENLRRGQSLVWEPKGPSGPYVKGYELWAIPTKDLSIAEPEYTIQPMSPFPPPEPQRTLNRENLSQLQDGDYYVFYANGIRLTIHRKHNEVIAYDKDLEEFELPNEIYNEFLAVEDPQVFIVDGFLSSKSFLMMDMPWWRDSEHTRQPAKVRKHFLKKLEGSDHINYLEGNYFASKEDAISFLQEEAGPYLLVPGDSEYPIDGKAEWSLFEAEGVELAGEGSDAKIRELMNSGEWEGMGADARFRLMTRRKDIEPLYPFAQLKTTKKGYSAKEVFGLKSVKDLAEELFEVPNKQAVEVKVDGFRIQVHKDGNRARLFTESGHEITKQLPTIVKDVQGLPAKSLVLDAEATPYSEDLTNLGRSGAAPAFAQGAKDPVDDSRWAIHVFDILYLDGESLQNLPYEERREKLRGIELPTRDIPKNASDFKLHLWENNVEWATSASSMISLAEKVTAVSGSEGAMFKQADSKYRMSGDTPLWCLTGGSRLFTKKGLIPVKDIKVGDEILTGIGTWGIVEAISTRMAVKGEDTIYDAMTNYGIKERMTGLHRVKVLRDNHPEWVPLEDVAIGEELLFPRPQIEELLPPEINDEKLYLRTIDSYQKTIPLTKAFWRVIGFWVGDGGGASDTTKGEIRFGISKDKDFSRYEDILVVHLGINVNHYLDEKRGILHHYIYDRPFAKWLHDHFRGKWNEKIIPIWMMHLPPDWFDGFMEGYFDADGTKNEIYRKRISTSSNQLINNFLLVCMMRGTPYASEYWKPRRGKGTFRFTEIKRPLKMWGEYYCFPLLKKERVRRRYDDWLLYDIQVSEGESFTGPYLTMHNSKMKVSYEIDALIVGLKKDGSSYNYIGAIGPVQSEADTTAPLDSAKGVKFVKWKGKVYSVLGKTFNTTEKADIGDIIRVTVKDVRKIDDQVYHWFHPKVLEVREDKTKPDPINTAQTISETASKKQKLAYLVSGRFEDQSPLACCLSPWIAIEGETEWTYLSHDDAAYDTLKGMGVEALVGTGAERALLEGWRDHGLEFQLTKASTIADIRGVEVYQETVLQNDVSINPLQLKAFYTSNRSPPELHMLLSCRCATVRLKIPKKLADAYLTYPGEDGKWKYVIQFHARGLSVHADFRAQINKNTLIGWTWDVGKSLLKPMLTHISDATLEKIGLNRSQVKGMTIKEVSEKVRSSNEGRALMKDLSMRTQNLSQKQLSTLMDELWDETMQQNLDDPNSKILTQRKAAEPIEWLTYEGEVPAGAVGATKELEGQFVIMDEGTVEFGAQKSYFHEYWLNGKRIKDRRFIVRRLATKPSWGVKEAFAWMTFFTKADAMPYTISTRAVSQKWMPPKTISAIPRKVRTMIPSNLQYWRAKNNREVRDELVTQIKKGDVPLKLSGLRFSVKRVWHKGPEVRRGRAVVRYWLLLHSGGKVLDAWDFGQDVDPLKSVGATARRRKGSGFQDLLKESGEIPATHPASYTKSLPNQFDTSEEGSAIIVSDTDDLLELKLNGKQLTGRHVFVRQDPGSEMWTFTKAELPETKKALMLSGLTDGRVMHLSPPDMETKKVGNLLFISGPAIKPGEVIPMDGNPSFFTKEGIRKMWPSMQRQPIVVLHGALKGDVIGFVDKIHYDEATGWGWLDRGVIWHPLGIQMILDGTLPAFSIEVLPECVWDPEHQHEHVIGGRCVGLAVVTVGACRTCTIQDASSGSLASLGEVYKFGLNAERFIHNAYWKFQQSTQEIADSMGMPRSTLESWMKKTGVPRRDYLEARRLRALNEKEIVRLGGRASITALGTGAFEDAGNDGLSRRNFTSTLFSIGLEHLLVNAPKGINSMLGVVAAKPKHVLLERMDEHALAGLHELRPFKPNVFAARETWIYLKNHYRQLSGEKGTFEEIYDFPRYVIKDQAFSLNDNFIVKPVEVKPGKTLGFKLTLGDRVIWHCSDILTMPDKMLSDVDIYIGDGTSQPSHARLEEQIQWAQDAGVKAIYFTQIGHIGSHDELNASLQKIASNAQALHDGAKIDMGGDSPGAIHSKATVEHLLSGGKVALVRKKPYEHLAKTTVLFGDEENVYGLYIEGYPEGPYSAAKVKTELFEEHGLDESEWKKELGDADTVWVYHPRVLKVFPAPRGYAAKDVIGPYGYNISLDP